MNIANLSVKRPIFITSLTIALMALGIYCFKKMPVDLFPDINIPNVAVQTVYAGAGPSEIETLLTKPLEDSLSNIAGIKKITSQSFEGLSVVMAEFNEGVNSQYAEQLVRDKVNQTRAKFPQGTKEPVITKIDLSALPILFIAMKADLSDAQIYDLADQIIKPQIEQVEKVGSVEIMGGRKREIHVLLDQNALRRKEMSVLQVADRIGAAGQNIPSGKVDAGGRESSFRSMGEFRSVGDVARTVVSLYGNESPTRVSDIGTVIDTVEDEHVRVTMDGARTLGLQVYRQSGANSVEVAEAVKAKLVKIQEQIASYPGHPTMVIAIDGSEQIRNEVEDVYLTIFIGIILTVLTVFLFLGNARSTFITSMALPVSLVGACLLMYLFDCSINVISLMAMSLAVGLLIDDAIVVIENIYRRMEGGEAPLAAVINGVSEIQLSVTAISMVVISVFLPVAFMRGAVGQLLKQYGLTVTFAMAISLFVALTIVPMLASLISRAYHRAAPGTGGLMTRGLEAFRSLQDRLSAVYERTLRVTLRYPRTVIIGSFLVFALCTASFVFVSKNFIPEIDNGALMVNLELAPGTSLDGMMPVIQETDRIIKGHPDVLLTVDIAGNRYRESNKGMLFVKLKDTRTLTTGQFKVWLRSALAPVARANPVVQNYDITGGAQSKQPLVIDLMSSDGDLLEDYANRILAKMRADKRLRDVDSDFRKGKPELQVILNDDAARLYGISSKTMGLELRGRIEGFTPVTFREKGYEYDVRVRLRPDQRDLRTHFNDILVPNVNYRQIRLRDVAASKEAVTVNSVNRLNRARHIQITADLAPGVGLGDVMGSISRMLRDDVKLPPQVRFAYAGNSDYYQEMIGSVLVAAGFALLFIFLILSSLYESFITPFTILLSLPLALCGAFLGLFVTRTSFDLFAIFGIFMLLGVAGKNSILLVDFILQRMREGHDKQEAIVLAGKERLRPILMTSIALIMGAVPIAIGINKASAMRTSMGITIIAGMISSTLLTLLVIPTVFSLINRVENRVRGAIKKRRP